jgi:hypothetical protein
LGNRKISKVVMITRAAGTEDRQYNGCHERYLDRYVRKLIKQRRNEGEAWEKGKHII